MNSEEFVPNERLRRARYLKSWSQAELAEEVGTSFEMVSRWERGISVPSPHYRKRLCAVLGQTAEELGLVRGLKNPFTPPSSPYILLASSHADAEKAIVSHLKTALEERGITLWSSNQIGKQGNGNAQAILREVVHAAHAILVVISPEARASRRVREALEMASRYQRPVCGVWIEGEHWQDCLTEGHVKLAALIDARERDHPAMLEETARALEQVRLASANGTEVAQSSIPDTPTEGVPLANLPTGMHLSTNSPEQPAELVTPQSQVAEISSPPRHSLKPTNTDRPTAATLPLPATPPMPSNRMGLSGIRVGLLIGLAILVVAGGLLGSLSLLAHLGGLGTLRGATTPAVRGGTWTDDFFQDPDSLIPNGGGGSLLIEQALYLPLFYADAQGFIHSGAATEVPTLQNGGISTDATTWTFHLQPRLVWSDGQPYDARDVDYTWKLWANPKFNGGNPVLNLISSAQVSADHLSITFHLKQAYAPFLSLWVDGAQAPLPAHHFSRLVPEAILKSPENLNPQVVSGPFTMSEYVPSNHYTLVRNPRYYRAREGLPYLDKVVFRIADPDAILKNLQVGSTDSAWFLDVDKWQAYQRLKNYTLTASPTSTNFEALYFNFHNTVLASHLEVRQAMEMAVDQQALIQHARHGAATPLCTDHGTFYHPGYDTRATCPQFNLAAANKLLEDNGWVKGPDGVRARGGQRLEFEYSTTTIGGWREATEAILQRTFMTIGIKLDIQNYRGETFFHSFLPGGKASPPTGALAGRYDIAEWQNYFGYDPDDSWVLACDQIPPKGANFTFYCNTSLDALYRQEQVTVDPGVRQQLFDQIHEFYLTEVPFIVLYSPLELAVVRKGTHNYLPSPIVGETVNIWEWWCDNGKC